VTTLASFDNNIIDVAPLFLPQEHELFGSGKNNGVLTPNGMRHWFAAKVQMKESGVTA
jgi:hypothetical protein